MLSKSRPPFTPTALHHLVQHQAELAPETTALWWQGCATSYSELWQRIEHLAGRLTGTGEPGQRIAVLAFNCPELLQLIYAVPAAGQVLVPLNARLAPAELVEQLKRSGARKLFGDAKLLATLTQCSNFQTAIEAVAEPAVEIIPFDASPFDHIPFDNSFSQWLTGAQGSLPATNPQDPVWILFTSGSTGRPKGAVLTHQSFLAGLDSAALGRPVLSSDRYYYPFPLFHVAAHNVMLQHQHGAAVVLARSFDATDTLQACRDIGVTTMSLAPTMIAMLLDHPQFDPADLASVRTIGYGASAMPVSLLRRLQSLSEVGLCQSYGMTELSGSVAFLTVEDHRIAAQGKEELLTSVGKPLPTAQVKMLNEQDMECPVGEAGEIVVRADQVMQAYWQDPKATGAALKNGWLYTGDIGRFDAQGYLFIVDRKKDMIISGGENVASREVEEALRHNPAVKDCAVIGLLDERWGETVCAVIVEQAPCDDKALTKHCREQLAGYKTPKHWFRLDALPLNASGKVDKPLLRRRYSQVKGAKNSPNN
jgi:acyl-CoA synthetase (AMP-forming)/AMP-acid ligase II